MHCHDDAATLLPTERNLVGIASESEFYYIVHFTKSAKTVDKRVSYFASIDRLVPEYPPCTVCTVR